MRKSHSQRPISTHRKPSNPAARSLRPYPVGVVNERNKLAKQEIAVGSFAIPLIDIKRVPAVRRDDQEFTHLLFTTQILQQSPFPVQGHRLLVSAQAMKRV